VGSYAWLIVHAAGQITEAMFDPEANDDPEELLDLWLMEESGVPDTDGYRWEFLGGDLGMFAEAQNHLLPLRDEIEELALAIIR
jgi:hypothetical protein